ncbi:hypothetical protein H257_12636 [Aphanomyces astaci]|uniref:Uncharacterized protein n=1 Tax=Aphanomyces astaci TaxID=112090 RepID=W4FXD3_APHAT|nr:hypothetical protein H257_12636 [Aphanomyces astaci]ETV72160.1 hypothetical protein H257_12636 [Aphanomyces astaci]|eukprot:XP_009838228.1 hypothetical protein H257_12636 [Aphanomyces astaci]
MPPKKKANTPFQDVTRMVATAENRMARESNSPALRDLHVSADQPHEAHERQCPKQSNQWTHLGRLLTIQKSNRLEPMEFSALHIYAQVGTVTDMLNVAIVDQGEFNDEEHESKCYDKLNPDEQVVVVREIVDNNPLETDAPPVLHGVWVRRAHTALDEEIDQLEALKKYYHNDEIPRPAIDSHD